MKRRSLKCNEVRYNSFTFPKGGKGDRLRWMRMSKKLYYQAFIKRTESLKLMTQSLNLYFPRSGNHHSRASEIIIRR